MTSKIELPIRRYEAGTTGKGARLELPDDKDVVLEQYDTGIQVHLLWPTVLSVYDFFDRATEVLGLEFDEIISQSLSKELVIPREQIKMRHEEIGIARLSINEDLGSLVWENFGNRGDFEGGVVSRHIGDISIGALMAQTGNSAVVNNLDVITEQVKAELQL
ncbi:MAG TPA: hypothetical protein VMR18_03630 [Candidatus Saccharimonadales bacterium]|nr:hypothetical protein [Candidatus Saccharimonadales bacterium]